MKLTAELNPEGPASYENMKAAQNAMAPLLVTEVPLYSDAYFTDEFISPDSPFSLINPLRSHEQKVAPSIILRSKIYRSYNHPKSMPYKADLSAFTGASIYDEIACLLSIQYGARLLAGGETRRFDGKDSFGRPSEDRYAPAVYLKGKFARQIIPSVSEPKVIYPGLLTSLVDLNPTEALVLIRAARQYRDAVWMAEEDPQLAWLLLVGAVEVVAQHEAVEYATPESVLQSCAPGIFSALQKYGDDATLELAPLLVPLYKSTAKFLDLFNKFPPPPPEKRPPDGYRIHPWNHEVLSSMLRKVYDWRSKALHAGIAFPLPMCEPPYLDPNNWEAPSESIMGLAASALGGVWTKKEMPFPLHIFEYVVRKVILSWWSAIAAQKCSRN
jgi:hypothetical protein